jgi:hypothetical protein
MLGWHVVITADQDTLWIEVKEAVEHLVVRYRQVQTGRAPGVSPSAT